MKHFQNKKVHHYICFLQIIYFTKRMITNRYFCRFLQSNLDEALHKKYITTDEYGLIQKFWYESLLYNLTMEDVDFLESFNLKLKILENAVQIESFPHLKQMCLRVCKKNPKLWKYETEIDGDFLFGLEISIDGCRIVKSEEDFCF